MRVQANTDLKVGLTVLIGIAILLGGIGWAKGWHFGSAKEYVLASFPSVAGLEVGDPVYIRGLKSGVVDRVDETPAGTVLVRMELYQPEKIFRDGSASISMLELMGGKKIEVLAGTAGSFNPFTDTLAGNSNGDLGTLVTFANSLTGTVQQLALRVDTVLNSINQIFGNGALKKKTYDLVDNISETVSDLKTVLKENRAGLNHLVTNVNQLSTDGISMLAELRPKINETLVSVQGLIVRSQSTMQRADSLLNSITTMLAEGRTNRSLLYKLTVDKQFSAQMDSTLHSINLLMKQVKEDGIDVNARLFH